MPRCMLPAGVFSPHPSMVWYGRGHPFLLAKGSLNLLTNQSFTRSLYDGTTMKEQRNLTLNSPKWPWVTIPARRTFRLRCSHLWRKVFGWWLSCLPCPMQYARTAVICSHSYMCTPKYRVCLERKHQLAPSCRFGSVGERAAVSPTVSVCSQA